MHVQKEPKPLSKEWLLWIARLEKQIARDGARDLRVLEKAGVNCKCLVQLLSHAATANHQVFKGPIRAQQAELRSLAGRLRAAANGADEVSSNPLSRLDFWIYLHNGIFLGMNPPGSWKESDPCIPFMVAAMRTFAKMCDQNAKCLGSYLRRLMQTDNSIVLVLISVVWQTKTTRYFEELARLLTDAFQAAGKRQSTGFSADGLRMMYKRLSPKIIQSVADSLAHQEKLKIEEKQSLDVPPVIPQQDR